MNNMTMARKLVKISIIIVSVTVLVSCMKEHNYRIIRNGYFYTLDDDNPTATVVVIQGDRIVYAGDDEGAESYTAKNTEVIDLKGAVALPGLIDAHAHMMSLGKFLNELSLKGVDSPWEVRRLVQEKAVNAPEGEWITGRGWDQNLWESKEFPTYEELGGVEANPVYLSRVGGHAVWVNKTALDLCGITRETDDPNGGRIVRFDSGEPTGILIDNAINLVRDKIPKASREVKKRWLLRAVRECAKWGLTGVGDAWVTKETLELYREIIAEDSMTMRVYCLLSDEAELLDEFYKSGPVVEYGGGLLTMRAVKLFADGALGSRGALLFEPYSDDESTCGIMVTGEEEIYRRAVEALKAGLQVSTHAIGDRANHITLNAYQRALAEIPGEDRRLRIEHDQVLIPKDIGRYRELRVIASMQPTHATSDMPWAEDRLGSERIKGAYAWRSLLDAGARLAFGSDFPVEQVNPFLGIYSAVTRQDLEGKPEGGWYPEQKLTVEEAVRGFTVWAAYAQFQEDEIGMIRAGMYADFTVIDRDIFQVSPREIAEAEVLMTIVGGEIVYQR